MKQFCNSQIKTNFVWANAYPCFCFRKGCTIQNRCVWLVLLRKGFVKTISINLELLTSLSGQSDKSIKIIIFIVKHWNQNVGCLKFISSRWCNAQLCLIWDIFNNFWWKYLTFNIFQTEMTTRAELAFKALDKDNSGYITNKEMKNLSSKLSAAELDALMKKVSVFFLDHVQDRKVLCHFSSILARLRRWRKIDIWWIQKNVWQNWFENSTKKSKKGRVRREFLKGTGGKKSFTQLSKVSGFLGWEFVVFVHNIVHCTFIHYESFTISSHNKVYNVFTSSCLPFNHSYNSIPSFLVVHKV